MLTLTTNGKVYTGFSTIDFFTSMNAVASSCYLRFKMDSKLMSNIEILKDHEVQISIKNKKILTGYVDAIEKEFNAESNQMHIYIRSKQSDLVDCSLISDPGEFKNQSLKEIITKFVSPFGISLISEVGDGGVFDKWSVTPGETVWENIEKATRIKGLLLVGDINGNLKLITPGKEQEKTQLIENLNIVEASQKSDNTRRYSNYIVKGQSPDLITDAIGETKDASIKRYRPLLIFSEAPVNISGARKRAEWENIIRAMRGEDLTITVNDWLTSPDGSHWETNKRTKVISPTLGIKEEYLITTIRYYSNEDRFPKTEIGLERIDSFIPTNSVNEKAKR